MAGSSAGSIYVDLLLRDAKFSEGIKRAGKSLSDFGSAAASGAKLAAGALAAAGAALGALAIHQAHVIDATVKVSRSLGIVNQDFQALATVSDEAGVEQERLAALILKSQKSITEAAKGGDAAAKAFKLLGLSASELIKLAPDKQFAKIEEALSKIENPTVRAATALQIFGKAGIDAVKISEDFAAKLKDAAAFNDKFNISVSAIDARKVEEANDTFGRLGKALGGIGNTIAVQTAPLVTALSKALLDSGIDGETATAAIKAGLEGAGVVIDTIRQGVLGLQAVFIKVAEVALDVAVKFREVALSFAEFAVKVSNSTSNLENLKNAQASLESTKALADGAADAYANLENEAANFETTSEKIAKIQEEATKRAAEAESKAGAAGSGTGLAVVDEKRLETLKSITSELEKQTATVQIQNNFFGESQAIIDRQLEQQQILQKLKEDGVVLTGTELQALNDKLALLESEKQLNIELQQAEKERQKAADELAKKQEDEKKRIEDSVQTVREDLAKGILDAATGAKSLGDAFKDVARKIAEAVIQAQLLRAITAATGGGGGGASGGGFLGGLLSFLPSFDSGTDYVPYDMVAKIHQGERVLTAEENQAYMSGAGVTMNVYTPDADSFRASDRQITRKIKSRMATA